MKKTLVISITILLTAGLFSIFILRGDLNGHWHCKLFQNMNDAHQSIKIDDSKIYFETSNGYRPSEDLFIKKVKGNEYIIHSHTAAKPIVGLTVHTFSATTQYENKKRDVENEGSSINFNRCWHFWHW